MVILAAVSINAAYNSGIINYAVNGTQQYVEGAHDEQSRIANAEGLMDSVMARLEGLGNSENNAGENNNGGSASINIVQPTLPTDTVEAGETADVNSTYTDGAGKKAVIPEGFTVSGIAAEQSIDTGLVIYDLGGTSSSTEGFWTNTTDPDETNGVTCPYNAMDEKCK